MTTKQALTGMGLAAMVIGLWAVTAKVILSEEVVSFDVLMADGAMICDKPESVTMSLDMGMLMPDCGYLRTTTGLSATVTITGAHDSSYGTHPLATFEFHKPVPWGVQTQYGWWAGEIPLDEPTVVPGSDA